MADEEKLQSNVQPDKTQQEPEPQEQEVKKEENVVAKNFEALREAKRKIERERDEALHKLKELEEKKEPLPQEDNEEDHVSQKLKDMESQLREHQTNYAATSTEMKLRSEFKDFDSVVNKDNIDILRERYPEVADTIFSSNNLYHKAKTAYTVMKKLGIALDNDTLSQGGKISKNLEKPRASNSASPTNSSTPLSKLNEYDRDNLSKEEKDRIYREMKRLADL